MSKSDGYQETDAIKLARAESRKRVRSAVRAEASIIADYVLDALIPAVDDAVTELGRPLVGTDWIRDTIVSGVDRKQLSKIAYDKIMEGQLRQKQLDA